MPAPPSSAPIPLTPRRGFSAPQRYALGLLLLLLPLLRVPCAAQEGADGTHDAYALVARAMRTKRLGCYVGRQEIWFSSARPQGGCTRIIADVARDGRRSRMDYRFPPTVADMLVADDGVRLRLYQPSCRLYRVGASPPPEDAEEAQTLALLRRNYRCVRQGELLITMDKGDARLCDEVRLMPRTPHCPWRRCWIDRAQGMTLRVEEYDAAGRRQYVSSWTSVRFPTHLPLSLFSPLLPPGATVQDAPPPPHALPWARACADAGVAGLAPCWSPSGFQLLHCASLARAGRGRALLLRYGDGLKTLSVFEETRTSALPPLPLQRRMLDEGMGRYGQQAWVTDSGGLRLTVVGDAALPPDVGEEMVRALSPASEERLARALRRDFGPGAGEGPALRRSGWGYDQIAARLLAHRHTTTSKLTPEDQARAWVTASLAAP